MVTQTKESLTQSNQTAHSSHFIIPRSLAAATVQHQLSLISPNCGHPFIVDFLGQVVLADQPHSIRDAPAAV